MRGCEGTHEGMYSGNEGTKHKGEAKDKPRFQVLVVRNLSAALAEAEQKGSSSTPKNLLHSTETRGPRYILA